MILENFNIDTDYISIIYQDKYIDLHNNYEFLNVDYIKESQEAKVFFKKRTEDWVPENTIENLYFQFKKVENVYIKKSVDNRYPNDDKCLELLVLSNKEIEDMEWIILDSKHENKASLLFIMVSTASYKICAESVSLII